MLTLAGSKRWNYTDGMKSRSFTYWQDGDAWLA
jgi:hypothetical protein